MVIYVEGKSLNILNHRRVIDMTSSESNLVRANKLFHRRNGAWNVWFSELVLSYSPSHNFFLRMCSSMNTRIPGLSRRALMSVLGVSGFAVLLSACGEDSKPAGAAVESSSSSSAESAGASSSASVSSSESPSPSSSVSPHYTGNSKAPEGEYRPADFYGLRRMSRSRRRRRGIRMLR